MIEEASIIPYTNNWKEIKIPKQNNYYYNDFKSEFELSVYYHLEMVKNNGGDINLEIDNLIKKYPNKQINKQELLDKFIVQIFE